MKIINCFLSVAIKIVSKHFTGSDPQQGTLAAKIPL